MIIFKKFKDFLLTRFTQVFIISISSYLLFFFNLLYPNIIFHVADAESYYIPARFYLHEKVFTENSFPFWTERQYLGFPIYADIEMGYLHIVNVLSILLLGPIQSYKFLHFIFYLIGSFSLYLFLKRYKIGILGFIAANTIFFFNQFFSYHQIHFNIILTFYLFPLGILLLDLFIETRRIRYIFYQAVVISSSILLGHLQSTVIFIFGITLFFLVKAPLKKFISLSVVYLILNLIVILILTLPQILPTAELYLKSQRQHEINYNFGSFTPLMTTFVFLPNVFTNNGVYIADSLRGDFISFLIHEMYIYLGISSFIIFILGYYLTPKSLIKNFAYLSLLLYIFLTTLGNNSLLGSNVYFLDLFRYWQRSVVIFGFGLAIFTAYFIENLPQLKINNFKRNSVYLAIPVIYIFLLEFFSKNNVINDFIFKSFFEYKFQDISVYSSLCFFLILLSSIKYKYIFYCKIGLVFLIFSDITFHSISISKNYLGYFNYNDNNEKQMYENKRVFIEESSSSGLQFLYNKSWSIFGFSNFVDSELLHYLANNEIKIKNSYLTDKNSIDPEEFNNLMPEKTGVKKVSLDEDISLNPNKQENILKTKNIPNFYIYKEGHFKFSYTANEREEILTKIRFNPHWQIIVNNVSQEFVRYDSIFLKFVMPEGDNLVEIRYTPKPFYMGLLVSGILLIILILSLIILKRYNLFDKLRD